MQQLTINVPDNKLNFFLELVQNLGFVQVGNNKKTTLTEHQKTQVEIERELIKNDPAYVLEWDTARKTLNLD